MQENTIKVRASSLSDYMDCSRRAAAKVFPFEISSAGFELRQLTNTIGAVVGTATHSGAMWGLEQKMKTGELGNATEAEHRAMDSLSQERAKGVSFDDTTPDIGTAQKQVARQLKSYRVHIAPLVEPTAVEQRVEAYATPHIILSGQTDTVSRAESIRDLKTGVKERYHAPQVGSYSLLERSKGHNIQSALVDFVPRAAMRKEQPLPTTTAYDIYVAEKLAWNILHRLKMDYDLFMDGGDPENFLPNPSSMLCADKFCPAWGTKFCTHHTKQKEVVVADPFA